MSHQVKELEQVPLDEAKYEELCQDQVKINNSQKLYENAAAVLEVLDNSENGICEHVRKAFPPMRALNQIDEQTASFYESLNQVQENTHQLAADLRDYMSSLSFQPSEAEEVNRKIDLYEDIRRKYGPGIADARKFYTDAKQKYDLLVNLEHNDADLKEKIAAAEKELKKCAQKLTAARKKTAGLLKETIERELKDLGIQHVTFEARMLAVEFNRHGQDEIVFYISPNAGEDLKPLSEIVSSGEAARVMLALKKALIKVDPIPVLIFDEIDAQIGGRLGTITGNKLKDLSRHRQVILITHLPQIASFADAHFKVIKEVKAGRTLTEVQLLGQKERVAELSHMMSGEDKSKISLSHAEDMLAKAQK